MSPLEIIYQLLKKHQDRDFYVDNIPHKKREAARAYYPIDRDDEILGIVDVTIFGSCENGLAFTSSGISWNNSWTTPTSVNRLYWQELLERKNEIKVDQYDLRLGYGAVICLAGSNVKPAKLFNVIYELIGAIEKILIQESNNIAEVEIVHEHKPKASQENNYIEQEIKILPNTNDKSAYANNLISCMALMISADGEIEESEIDLAIEFINEEELIEDKHKAIKDLEAGLEKLISSKNKAQALYKLQVEKMVSGFNKIHDEQLLIRLEIMLQGLLATTKEEGRSVSQEISNKIIARLTK